MSPAPLRVLMVVGAYFPEISSGGQLCRVAAQHLQGETEIRILTTVGRPDLPRNEVVDNVAVSRVFVDVTSRYSKARATFWMLSTLVRLLARVDVVHLHGVSSKNVLVTAVSKLFRRRIVLTLHTARHDEPAAVARQGRLAWWAYRSADLTLSVGPRLLESYLAAGLPSDRARHVPNGVDVERFAPASGVTRAEIRRRLGFTPNQPLVLFVGFLSRDKQPHVLFDAWIRLQTDPSLTSTLAFVGATASSHFEVDPDLARTIREEAERRGLAGRVRFVEPTSRVDEYYRAADLFVLPSVREGLPLSLLEAMATGLPCVASRLTGATDVILEHGSNGLLVPPGDVNAFVAAMTSILRDPAYGEVLGAAARVRVCRDFSSRQMARRWLDAYRHA